MLVTKILGRFQQLNIRASCILKYSTFLENDKTKSGLVLYPTAGKDSKSGSSIYEPNFQSFRSTLINVDINLPNVGIINEIIDKGITVNRIINDPVKIDKNLEEQPPKNDLELPTANVKIEKHAHRMIRIRHKKMKKHKRRKFYKKMKFAYRKIKLRREIQKEKAFHAELLAKIREANDFNAKDYVNSRLSILDNVRIPNKWKGEILPESMIRKFMAEEEEKKKKRQYPDISL